MTMSVNIRSKVRTAFIMRRASAPSGACLFVAEFADTTALTMAGASGADAVVLKPFRDSELERKVASALAARPAAGLRLVSDRTR